MKLPARLRTTATSGAVTKTHIQIAPGEYHVARQDIIISTVLGSCVSACLFDPVAKIIGMNHFLLSNDRYSKDMPMCATEAGRYGVHAMELLINEMVNTGAQRRNLRAKAFGGGDVLFVNGGNRAILSVGRVNCRFIKEFLERESIPLVAADLGGDMGRVIHFSSQDFSVYTRKIEKMANKELVVL